MSRRRAVSAVTAGAAVLALGSALLSVGPAVGLTSGSAGASSADRRAGPTTSRTLLVTGDTVRVTAGSGPDRIGVVPRSGTGVAGHFTTTRVDGRTYVIPAVASRYLGVLDRSLFAVGADSSSGDPTVTLSVQPGATPSVPGLTVTSRTASSWRGHFTPAGARAFGAALTSQWRQDAAAHRVSRTLFGGVTRMARPGVQQTAEPRFPQQTLTLTVIGPNGKPADFADVALTNVSDGTSKYANFVSVVGGVAKVSVPLGTYSALATIDTFSRDRFTAYFVPVEEVEVDGAGAEMVFDARRATARPAVHTPRPASLAGLNLEWDRLSGRGGVSTSYGFSGSGFTVRVAPSGQATKGRLDWLTNWQLAATPTDSLPYTYDLAFHDEGRVPADQDRTVTPADLAQVDSRYFTDRVGTGVFGRGPLYPFQNFTFISLYEQPTPLTRTEYVAGPDDAAWSAAYFALGFDGEVDVFDGLRTYAPGSTSTADWLRGPLGPAISQPTPADTFVFCGYCRTATSMAIGMAALADSTPGHSGAFFSGEGGLEGRFRLYRNGTLIDDVTGDTGDQVEVTPGSATYRAVVDTKRGRAGYATSTTARTEVTFVSSATSGAPAPSGWQCSDEDPCTVLPVLVSEVPLPTDLTSTMPLGSNTMAFTVDHAVGAADPTLTGVSVELTYDGGKTYVAMPVTQTSAHRFLTTLRNPPGSARKAVGFRLTATDAAGGRLVQTAQAAYFVAQS